ncbi:MAG: HIT domain-containing protein [Candidatus Abawacabacteria bacterium]|nr:HIT domain-containing protein [Candidatus Abawacabacteria bacterium]
MQSKITNDFYCDFVLNNKIVVKMVRETKKVLAFHHTQPKWTLHIVIIPKQHITRLVELEDISVIAEIFSVAQDIIKEFRLHESNYKIITNGGSFQDSQHLHFHLVSGKKHEVNE